MNSLDNLLQKRELLLVFVCTENPARRLICLELFLVGGRHPDATAARHKPRALPGCPLHTIGTKSVGTVKDAFEVGIIIANNENVRISNTSRKILRDFIDGSLTLQIIKGYIKRI